MESVETNSITINDIIKENESGKIKTNLELEEVKTMHDSIELMNSTDYKDRFIAEYIQTKIRYDKLHNMLIKLEAGTLTFEPSCSQEILEDQAYYMGNYLKMLEIRAEIEKINLPLVIRNRMMNSFER